MNDKFLNAEQAMQVARTFAKAVVEATPGNDWPYARADIFMKSEHELDTIIQTMGLTEIRTHEDGGRAADFFTAPCITVTFMTFGTKK
jgi:hypothetical protein